jgi:hypothetical protein
VHLSVARLDDVEADLITFIQRVAGDANTALYEFSVSADAVVLISGRAAITFDVAAEPS